jgi:hypothetical protein
MIILCDGIDTKDSNNLEGWRGKKIKFTLSYKFFYKRFLFIEIITFDVHISKIRLF